MSELAALFDNALRDPDPATGIARAKQLVRTHLERTEPKAEIRETDYFDHSFAPDLVLKPRGGKSGSERWVFLRTTSDPEELADDLEVVPKGGTLFVSLDEFREPDERTLPFRNLDRTSAERGSLVIDAPALERVSDSEVAQSSTALLTRALITAGRGALGESETRRELETFAVGVSGAMTGDSGTTRVAVERIGRRLGATEANKVTSFLGALWEGGGRSLTEFPGRLGTEGLTSAGLAILLEGPDLPNDSFWQRVAARTSLADIIDAVEGSSDNLQRLVKGGVDYIKAHVCLVDRDEQGLWDDMPAWRWIVDQGCLGLTGPGFTAYVAANRDNLPEPEAFRGTVDLAELRARARRFRIPLREIRMRTPHRTVGYDSPNGEDIVGDQELDQIGSALGQHSVAHVEATIAGDQRLAVDFVDGMAGMVAPRVQVPIRRLLGTAIHLLEPLTDADAEVLHELIQPLPPAGPQSSEWEQRSLFDED